MYSIEYTAHAIRNMEKLPTDAKKRIFKTIGKLKEDPYDYVQKLKTSSKTPMYSMRFGEYRVIMSIKDPLLIIQVTK